jgi:UDP-2-acetamido-3-amino-2,3-dideoxy-glucuronate N-acetyltransferase
MPEVSTGVPRLALVGCGPWGRNLARHLHDLGVLAAVCDQAPDPRAWVRQTYPGVTVMSQATEVIGNPALSAVAIATPAASHAALARSALEAGQDVFVEKPLALTVAEGEELVRLAERQARVLMVGHLLEYHPAVTRLRELVRDGTLGRLRYVYSSRLNHGRIRTEESALWSFAPHDVHVILRLLGEQPEAVACHGGHYVQRGVADVTMTVLSFASGVRAHVFVSWLHPFKEQKLVVVGERQMAVFDDTRREEKLQLFPHRIDWVDQVPVAIKVRGETVAVPGIEPLGEECRHLVACLASRGRPASDGASGVAVLRVLEACQASLDAGGAVVRLAPSAGPAGDATPYFAHPTAAIDPGARIGAASRVWHFSHVMAGARVGRNTTLGQNVFVASGAVVGDNVKIQNNVSVYDGVVLEDDVFCGPGAVFTNVEHPRSHVPRKGEFRATVVRRGATIGANATVVCGHTVGAYAFVGAGAVVTRDVPDHALVLGVPARVVGWVCRCGVPLVFEDGRAKCAECRAAYQRAGEHVTPRDADGP